MKLTSQQIHRAITELVDLTGDPDLALYLLPRIGDTVILTRKSDKVTLCAGLSIVISDITENFIIYNGNNSKGELPLSGNVRIDDVTVDIVYNQRDTIELVALVAPYILDFCGLFF